MKKRLYKLHGWLGLNFGLVLFVVCLSGTVAVLSHEIDWLLTPALRVTPSDTQADWSTMTQAVRADYPEASIQYAYAPLGSRFACEFLVRSPSDHLERVYVDPYRGNVTGRAPWFNTQRFFRDFHRRFFWYSSWGIVLVAAFAYVMLFSAATGLMFYKRWWAKLFVLRFTAGLRIFSSDLHRLLGVWTLLFAIVIGITGVWYSVEGPVNRTFHDRGARTPRLTPPANAKPESRLPPGEWVRAAKASIPELNIRSIWFPGKPNAPARIQGQASAWLVRNRANEVVVDPYTGDVLSMQRAEELKALARWTDTADPLHFGTFGGLTTKLIWFVFGLALSALMPVGAYLWWRRRLQMAEGIAKRLNRSGNPPANLAASIRSETRRSMSVGLGSTLAIWLLAT